MSSSRSSSWWRVYANAHYDEYDDNMEFVDLLDEAGNVIVTVTQPVYQREHDSYVGKYGETSGHYDELHAHLVRVLVVTVDPFEDWIEAFA